MATARRALVAGVQTWLDAAVPPRHGVCAALRRVALRLEEGGFEVRRLLDDEASDERRPLLGNLLDGLAWLRGADEVLLVLAGRAREGRFLPRDVRLARLDRTALSYAELAAELPTHAGLVLDAPADPAPFGKIRWALGTAPADDAAPGPLLDALDRAFGTDTLTSGALARAAREADGRAWSLGATDVTLLDAATRHPRRCAGCQRAVEDAAASFCPACGTSLPTAEQLDGGRYRLLGPLGEGGMGQVYLAEDTRLGVRRAIKLMSVPPGFPPDEVQGLRARMIQEARAAQALAERTHHVVRVFDVGFSPERQEPFLVMEVLEGETLTRRLSRSRLRLDEALALGRTIAETLAAAHRQSIVHRDLKPDNVMLVRRGEEEGFVKLLDFGLVKMAQARVKTASGRMMGTLQYMPPEQLRGQPVDVRADVFSLGAVLYECLSGRRANPGRTQQEIFAVLLDKGVEPLARLCPALPQPLTELVDRCLRLDRAERPADAAEVAAALAAIEPVPSGYEPTLPGSEPGVERLPGAPSTPSSGSLSSGSLAVGEVSLGEAAAVRRSRAPLYGVGAAAVAGLLALAWPTPEPPPRTQATVVVAPQPDAAPAPPPPDAAPPPPADAGAVALPVAPLPERFAVTRAVAGEAVVYRGGGEPERLAALAAELLLGEAEPGAPDEVGEARWREAAPGVRAWLAAALPVAALRGYADRTEIPLAAWRAARDAKPAAHAVPGVGRLLAAADRPPVFEAALCARLEAGDRLIAASWTTPGYADGRCAGADCPPRLVQAVQSGRRVGETVHLRLTVLRGSGVGEDAESRLDISCRVRP